MTALLEKRTYTYEDIKTLPEGWYEIVNGEKVDMTPTGFRYGRLEGIFAALLREHFKDNGYIAVGEVGIVINKSPLTIRAADIVYITKNRVPVEPEGLLETAPDLIIEIVSESNTQWHMTDKVKDYLLIGVGRVILVDPQTDTISIYINGKKEILLYNFDEEFEVLEGLKVKMRELL